MAEPGFWERLNPVNQLRSRLDRFRNHPIQSTISTALGFVNPALGFGSQAAFDAYNRQNQQNIPQTQHGPYVRPSLMSGTGYTSAGFDNYGASDHGADAGMGYEDYGSVLTGEPNAPDNYVESPKEKQFNDRGMEIREKEKSWSGVVGQGANGELLIRGVMPMTQNRAVYNKRRNNNS
jgi:hypothetical protein